MAALEDKFDDIKKLIDAGKEKGYLTYGDVNDMLPEDMHNADDLDDLIDTAALFAAARSHLPQPAQFALGFAASEQA